MRKRRQLTKRTVTLPERRKRGAPGDHRTQIVSISGMRQRKEYSNTQCRPRQYSDRQSPTPTIRDDDHKRVAVYARVSTKSKEQVSSIENQTKYYTEKIARTPNWELAEIYSDEGKSGTSKKWRTNFKRMLEDAAKKKMDLIVCASVSRFARNISDLIEEVRKLRTTNPSNPVGVYFETEDLYTLDPNINERLQMQGYVC